MLSDSFLDQFFGQIQFAFKIFRRLSLGRDVRFEVDGKMFGGRDEARGNGDIAVFFTA